jgi:hypothetical protein
MGLDIRMPLGLLFSATGGLMAIYGLYTRGSAIYEKSLYLNINLIWGLVLLLFGLLMLVLAWTSNRRKSGPQALPDGDETQRPSHRGH